MEKNKAEAKSSIKSETFMKVNGMMTKNTASASISILMAKYMKAHLP